MLWQPSVSGVRGRNTWLPSFTNACGHRVPPPQFWSAQDLTCKRTIRSTFEVEIIKVSAEGKFVFVVGENGGNGGGNHRRKAVKRRAVIAVWNGRKRGTTYAGYGAERDPIRLIVGHGRPIQSLYTPKDPGERSRMIWLIALFHPRCISDDTQLIVHRPPFLPPRTPLTPRHHTSNKPVTL